MKILMNYLSVPLLMLMSLTFSIILVTPGISQAGTSDINVSPTSAKVMCPAEYGSNADDDEEDEEETEEAEQK